MNSGRQSIQERCIELIAQAKQVPRESVLPESTFEELGLDSLDKVTLAFDVEETYDISIPESQLATIRSLQEMVTGIERALAAKNETVSGTS
jgi:acyl carrier protein